MMKTTEKNEHRAQLKEMCEMLVHKGYTGLETSTGEQLDEKGELLQQKCAQVSGDDPLSYQDLFPIEVSRKNYQKHGCPYHEAVAILIDYMPGQGFHVCQVSVIRMYGQDVYSAVNIALKPGEMIPFDQAKGMLQVIDGKRRITGKLVMEKSFELKSVLVKRKGKKVPR